MSCICSKCGKECKDKRGLTLHDKKCGIERTTICIHCNGNFSTPENLQRHYLTCRVYRETKEEEEKAKEQAAIEECLRKAQQEYDQKIQQSVQTYEQKIQQSVQTYEQKIKQSEQKAQSYTDSLIATFKEDQRILAQERDILVYKNKEQEKLLQDYKEKIYQLEKKNDLLNGKMIHFAEKAVDKGPTTIYQNNTVQNNTLKLQSFDPTLFRDQINPPHCMIYSVPQMVDLLHNCGLGNMYRSLDRSRNVIMWVDQDGKEVRDTNCSQLREKTIDSMEEGCRLQLEYLLQRESQLERMEGTEHLEELTGVRSHINFCRRILDRNTGTMKELQKELSKRAKNKKDTTIDIPRGSTNTKFLSKVEELLFPAVHKWMGMSFEEWGRWIARGLGEDITIEGSMLYKDRKFIKIKNDDSQTRIVYGQEWAKILRGVYNEAIPQKARWVYHSYLPYHPEITKDQIIHIEEKLEWFENGGETQAETIIKGVLLQKMNR
jgi:hypothetical protein